MNRCPKCGTNVREGEAFCRMCGTKLTPPQPTQNSTEQGTQPNNQFLNNNEPNTGFGFQETAHQGQNNNNQFNNGMMQNNTINSSINQNINNGMTQNSGYQNSNVGQNYGYSTNNGMPQNNYVNDIDLIDAYIGNNADKLKNGGFSINTFLFGVLYVLYRKMWLLGFVWLAINIIVSMFLPSISTYVTWGANIIISLQFKKLYLNHVSEEVNKIKIENPGKTNEQLMLLCSQKGGTTLIPVVIVGIIYGIMFFIAYTVVMGIMDDTKDKIKEQQDYYNNMSTKTIGNLSYKVPDILFEDSTSTDTNKAYSSYSGTNFCTLIVSTTDAKLYANDAKIFLEGHVSHSATDTYSGITAKSLNKRAWYYAEVISDTDESYYYAILNNGKIYNLEFLIFNDENEKCSEAREELANSLKLD